MDYLNNSLNSSTATYLSKVCTKFAFDNHCSNIFWKPHFISRHFLANVAAYVLTSTLVYILQSIQTLFNVMSLRSIVRSKAKRKITAAQSEEVFCWVKEMPQPLVSAWNWHFWKFYNILREILCINQANKKVLSPRFNRILSLLRVEANNFVFNFPCSFHSIILLLSLLFWFATLL